MSEPARTIELLLVEDNPADVRLTREVLKEGKLLNNLSVVMDGEEAVHFLRREGRYADAPRPDLVLLDLNLPKLNGREVLAIVKEDDDLKRIPVVILTVSDHEADILDSYDHHANCYIRKPVDLSRFIEVARSIETFWLTIVTLPPDGHK
jgi:chemotaxis family two-component system response regulator Rcp1